MPVGEFGGSTRSEAGTQPTAITEQLARVMSSRENFGNMV
jgi:hypothetical protein